MKIKNKEKLLLLLMLNAISFSENLDNKSENLSDNFLENIETKKPGNELYKLIERRFAKKNKELKDLYMQGDYIAKPEYLEWQIFFSSFNDIKRSGGSKENYSNDKDDKVRSLDFGLSIPIRDKKVQSPKEYDINLKNPEIDLKDIIIELPTVKSPNINYDTPDIYISGSPGSDFTPMTNTAEDVIFGSNTRGVSFSYSGEYMFENLNATADNVIIEIDVPNSKGIITGNASYQNYISGNMGPHIHNNLPNRMAVHNVDGGTNLNIDGTWTMKVNNGEKGGIWGFISEKTNGITKDGKVVFSGDLFLDATINENLLINPIVSLVGMSLSLSDTRDGNIHKVSIENTGNINLINTNSSSSMAIGMQVASPSGTNTIGEVINRGEINILMNGFRSPHGIYGGTGIYISSRRTKPDLIYVDSGNINVRGSGNRGIEIGDKDSQTFDKLSNLEINGSNGLLYVDGKENIGLLSNSVLGSNNLKSINILVNGNENLGILSRGNGQLKTTILNKDMISKLQFGDSANKSILLSLHGNTIIEENLKEAIGVIDKGINSSIVHVGSGDDFIVTNNMPIIMKIDDEKYFGTIAIRNEGNLKNYGEINIIGKSLNKGIYSRGGSLENYASIYIEGLSASGIISNGNLYNESEEISIKGDFGRGVALMRDNLLDYNSIIKLNNMKISGNGTVAFYTERVDTKLLSLDPSKKMEINIDGDSFAFINREHQYYQNKEGKFHIENEVEVNLKNGGIAIEILGDRNLNNFIDINLELDKRFDTTNGKLIINKDNDSYNMLIAYTGLRVSNLSNLNYNNIILQDPGKIKLYEAYLLVDKDSNLNKNDTIGDKTYRDILAAVTDIEIDSDILIIGNESNQIALKQVTGQYDRITKLINNGKIELSGSESIGIYSKRSKQNNHGLIKIFGNQGIGMYVTAGEVENSGNIIIANQGIGIYGENNLDPNEYPSIYPYFSIKSSGRIIAESGEKGVGIYANKNSDYGDGIVELDNGEIDMSNSKNGIGIYSSKIDIVGKGKIKVGEKGTGIYIKNGNIQLLDLELDLSGDEITGIYLDEDSTFTGSGTVNIDGKNIVVFNVASSGYYDQNFIINSISDSSYLFQNIRDRTLVFNGTIKLGSGGIYTHGVNSDIVLDVLADINSYNSSNNTYDSNMTGVISSGSQGKVTNKGKITFGNNSIGIYVKNGGYSKNEGEITLGKDSVGLYGKDNGANIINEISGEISIQDNSVGIAQENGSSIINNGKISGTGEKVIGVYSDSINNTSILMNGSINLIGNRSVGAYLSGSGIQELTNNGTINAGSSNLETDPSIGVYNNTSTNKIINNNQIFGGENSIGIYNKGGKVLQNTGSITTGKNGVAVYTESGIVSLLGGYLNVLNENGVGIYATDKAEIINNSKILISDNSYGIVLHSDSSVINNSGLIELGENGIFIYSDGGHSVVNNLGSDILMKGSNSAGIYTIEGVNVDNYANIAGNIGQGNIGILNKSGNLMNAGNIKVGDSIIIDEKNPLLNNYAIGIYGEDTKDFKNTGDIEIGYRSIGLYIKKGMNNVSNSGNIYSSKEGSIGIYAEDSIIKNMGDITLSGDNAIGIVALRKSDISNSGTITMNGNNNIGIYADVNSKIVNEKTGIININGNDSIGVQLLNGSILENYGEINLSTGITGSKDIVTGEGKYSPPSIINGGVIKVDEKFEIDDLNLTIKVDPDSLRVPTIEEITVGGYSPEDSDAGYLISNSTTIVAPDFDLKGGVVNIDPSFTQGTNLRVYKFENVFDPSTPEGGPNTGEMKIESGSLTFDSIPVINKDTGGIDIWMEKIDYNKFTEGSWKNEFAENIEEKYLNATGKALILYDRIDLIKERQELNKKFDELAGTIYSNMNQREQTVADIFENSLGILQNSSNNTKENVKVNIIAGKGEIKEETEGVTGYDYISAGVQLLREVERTYRHTFGYSLGYLHTNFDYKDTGDSEEKVDTLQLGIHNKYKVNEWLLKNDLTGRVSFHDMERNIEWTHSGKSEMTGRYESYSLTSDNKLGREFELGKRGSVMPYGGLKVIYGVRPTFSEKGLESLEVDGNDAWSIKPKVGVELRGTAPLGANWKLKGSLDVSYEYELADFNEREYAKLTAVEDTYHKLSKPEEDKGIFKTKATVGIEIEDRYGVFLTGEYNIGDNSYNKDDYRVGIMLKAAF